jgi:glycosyltransferase involved in cell wall biosynthesis
MKILLVHNRYKIEGGEEVVFEQERRMLERAGHEVMTYTRTNFEADEYHGLRQLTLIKNIAWSNSAKHELSDLLKKYKPEIVHVHNFFMMMSPSIFQACRDAGVPVIQTLHNFRLFCPGALFVREGKACEECVEHSLWRGIRYGCYRNSHTATAAVALMITLQRQRQAYPDAFIALTDFARQNFIANGIPADKIFLKPNFVDPDPGERQSEAGYALYAGRLSQEKGINTLLAAWEQLGQDIPLEVVGDGPLLDWAQQRVKEAGVRGITFHGRQPRNRAVEIMKGARFLVTPSHFYENFPMVIAEAFACGVPVICSRLGSMQEIVENKRTGLHFTQGNAADLASKVLWAWSHPEQVQDMGREARREYQAKYTAETNYLQLTDIYRRAVRGESAANLDKAEVGLSLSRG